MVSLGAGRKAGLHRLKEMANCELRIEKKEREARKGLGGSL